MPSSRSKWGTHKLCNGAASSFVQTNDDSVYIHFGLYSRSTPLLNISRALSLRGGEKIWHGRLERMELHLHFTKTHTSARSCEYPNHSYFLVSEYDTLAYINDIWIAVVLMVGVEKGSETSSPQMISSFTSSTLLPAWNIRLSGLLLHDDIKYWTTRSPSGDINQENIDGRPP